MKKQVEELRLQRSLASYLDAIEYMLCDELERSRHNLQITKQSGSKEDIDNCKLQIKCINYKLKWLDNQKSEICPSYYVTNN